MQADFAARWQTGAASAPFRAVTRFGRVEAFAPVLLVILVACSKSAPEPEEAPPEETRPEETSSDEPSAQSAESS